jgi:hypothetical protein
LRPGAISPAARYHDTSPVIPAALALPAWLGQKWLIEIDIIDIE